MKYLCLVYGVESVVAATPPADLQKLMGEYQAFGESLKRNGQYLAAERLRPVHTATTVRVRDGKVSTTDGPFAESKEQLGGSGRRRMALDSSPSHRRPCHVA